jgi:phosphoglycolate phosphatase
MTLKTIVRPRRFDLIAFDWDGTLFDSTAIITRSIQAAVRDVGGTVPRRAGVLCDRHGADAGAGPCGARCAARQIPELANRYRYHFFSIRTHQPV